LSAPRTGRLYPPRKYSWYSFPQRLSRPQGRSAARRIISMKNSSDTTGIEPATFLLVAQRLNQLCYCVPPANIQTTTFYFSEKDENNTFSHIHLFKILCSHSIPRLQISDTKFGLKMCVNYARKLISKTVPHSHELHNMNSACQHKQACQCLPYWNQKGIKSKSYHEQPSK